MLRVALSSIRAHPVRLLSTALAVVLGIAFVAGTLIYSDTTRGAFDELFASEERPRALAVQPVSDFSTSFQGGPPTGLSVPPELAEEVEGVEGVAAAAPVYSGLAQLFDADGEPIGGGGAPTQGDAVPQIPELSDVELRAGRLPDSEGEIALDAATAADQGLAPGGTIRVSTGGPIEQLEVVGVFGFQGDPDYGTSTFSLLDPATARDRYGASGASSIEVLLAEGVDPAEGRDEVAAAIGDEYDVLTGAEVADQSRSDIGQFLGFIETFLLVFAGISLLVGGFIIFNTFTITVAQRTRELALLRAVGAQRRQVLGAVLAEALVVGLVGSALGLGLGLLLALAIRALFEALGIGLPSGDLVVAARTPIVALVVGTLITVLASVVPAIRGTRVAPVEALRDVSAPPSPTSSRIRLGLVLLLLVLGVGSLVLGLFGSGGLAAIGPGSALVILAVALLSSLVAGPIASALGAPVSALRGLPGELARENAVRNPRRTASTASALMIGVGLVSFVLIVAASLQASIDKIIADQFRAELQVTAVDFTGLPDGALDALDDVDGVAAASPQSVATIGVDGDARGALVLDPATIGETYAIEVSEGDLARLGEGTIALGTDFAAAEDLGVGDALEVQLSPTGEPTPFEVVAIYDPASIGDGNPVAVDYEVYRDAVPDVRAFLVSVALEEGADVADVRTSIDAALADFPAVEVQDLDEIRAEIATQTNQLLGGIFALLFLSVFIALFGIVNTLNLSILERTRELGLLRAVGMSRRQTRTMVRWESVVISVLGGLLGLVVGVLFGALAVSALRDEGFEVLELPVLQLVLALVLSALAGIAAAVIPARRASRVDILRAIAAE